MSTDVRTVGGALQLDATYDFKGVGRFINPLITEQPVSVTGTTFSPTQAAHDNRLLVFNNASGCTVTLPAATGSGTYFRFLIGTAVTSNSFKVQVANASDYMRGFAYGNLQGTGSTTFSTLNTGTVSTEGDTMTFNRTTTGTAVVGDYFEVLDMATNIWSVEATYNYSGTAATPFTAAV